MRRVTLRGAPAKVRACSTARVSDETIEVHRVSDDVIELHRVMRERVCVDGEVSDLKSRGRTSAEKSSPRFSRSLSALSPRGGGAVLLRPESLEVSVEVLEFAALDVEIVRDRGRRRVALVRTNSQKGNDKGDDF